MPIKYSWRLSNVWQECEDELTQKAEVVSRLQAKTLQIGQMLSNLQKFNHLLNEDNANRSSTNGNYGTGLRSMKQQPRYVAQSSTKEAGESKSQRVETQQNVVCVESGTKNASASANEAEIADPKKCEQAGKNESEAKVESESSPQDGGQRSDEKKSDLENFSQSSTA